jgi:hypothetical protein
MSQMVFGSTSAASGAITDTLAGTFNGTFFYQPWMATPVAFFDTHGSTVNWAGTAPQGAFNYAFTLTGNQVAFGLYFDWSVNAGIPVLAMFDCAPGTTGSACLGFGPGTANGGVPMQTAPFPGQDPKFNGVLTAGSVPFSGAAVPVPAAVWLFGSGLLGLVGIARRKKKA